VLPQSCTLECDQRLVALKSNKGIVGVTMNIANRLNLKCSIVESDTEPNAKMLQSL